MLKWLGVPLCRLPEGKLNERSRNIFQQTFFDQTSCVPITQGAWRCYVYGKITCFFPNSYCVAYKNVFDYIITQLHHLAQQEILPEIPLGCLADPHHTYGRLFELICFQCLTNIV